jgi:hypothetical protein
MMLEELQRRNYSEETIRTYIRSVERYAMFFGKAPDKLGLEHLRTYQAYLLKTRKLSAGSVENHVAALRFFYVRTLRRPEFREYIPYPRTRRVAPVLSYFPTKIRVPPVPRIWGPVRGAIGWMTLRKSEEN